jgi:hypothetical protein
MKYPLWRRLPIGKWFRFLRWSTQRRIGHLSPCAMMDHFGFIVAHGRRSRAYRRLLTGRPAFGERSELAGQRLVEKGVRLAGALMSALNGSAGRPASKSSKFDVLSRTLRKAGCDQIRIWKLIRRRPTLALPKSECLRKSSQYRRPYISRPA